MHSPSMDSRQTTMNSLVITQWLTCEAPGFNESTNGLKSFLVLSAADVCLFFIVSNASNPFFHLSTLFCVGSAVRMKEHFFYFVKCLWNIQYLHLGSRIHSEIHWFDRHCQSQRDKNISRQLRCVHFLVRDTISSFFVNENLMTEDIYGSYVWKKVAKTMTEIFGCRGSTPKKLLRVCLIDSKYEN